MTSPEEKYVVYVVRSGQQTSDLTSGVSNHINYLNELNFNALKWEMIDLEFNRMSSSLIFGDVLLLNDVASFSLLQF